MIRYLLLQNRAGKTRLAKYYVPMDDAEKHATEYDVHKTISTRDPKYTNFIEVPPPPFQQQLPSAPAWLDPAACAVLSSPPTSFRSVQTAALTMQAHHLLTDS